MNMKQLADELASRTGGSKAVARDTVGHVLDIIAGQLAEGGAVRLDGFGAFEVRDVAARTGRNPATGAVIQIAAGRKVAFRPSSALRASLG